MKRKIRFKRGFSGNPPVEVTLGEYIRYDISLASLSTYGQVEVLKDELDELRGYFERLLDIIEPDLSEAEILMLCKRTEASSSDGFEIVEGEEAFVVAEEDEYLEDR